MRVSHDITGMERDEIIKKYARLATTVAYKLIQRLPASVELDDLVSAGILGLIDAIDKYDPEKSDNFKKYAEIRIRGAMLDELRSMDWVSRTIRRQSSKLEGTRKQLRQELGRDATDVEMAEELGVNLEQYFELIHKLRPVLLVSFENLGIGADGERRSFSQFLEDPKAIDPSQVAYFRQLRALLGELIEQLPEKQRVVITLYYFDHLNLKEVGKVLEVTESRVSQLHAQAVKSLKAKVKRHFNKVRTTS
jgi:RNA polymerase sigma factor for flagellar operon FliA